MLRTVVFALTLNPSPYLGEGQLCGSPSPKFGRRGWGMRVYFFSYRKNYNFQGGRGLTLALGVRFGVSFSIRVEKSKFYNSICTLMN